MSKKTLLIISITVTILTGLSFFSRDLALSSNLCPLISPDVCWSYVRDIKDVFDPFIFLFPIVLIFSLTTYRLHEEIFRAWLKFAYLWVPLSIVVMFLLSMDTGGGGFGMNLIHPEAIAMFFAGVFTVVSIVIIAWKYMATRRG